MNDPVEAVAKALYNAQLSPVLESHAWERADPALQEDYRTLARAALGAEPVARLVEAAKVIRHQYDLGHYHGPFGGCPVCSLEAALEPFAGITEGSGDA